MNAPFKIINPGGQRRIRSGERVRRRWTDGAGQVAFRLELVSSFDFPTVSLIAQITRG